MDVMCNDNRFEVIAKAKEHLLEATNIDTSPDEMEVIDNFLFRCWQMGWLDKYDPLSDEEKKVVAHIHVDPDKVLQRLKEEYRIELFGIWVPVEEGLPEEEDKVLCQTITKKGTRNMVIGYYADGRWCCGMNSNVVAWTPLPDPYTGGEPHDN